MKYHYRFKGHPESEKRVVTARDIEKAADKIREKNRHNHRGFTIWEASPPGEVET